MNLKKKKKLAARTFLVGAERIMFNPARADEIKEAITKQDMRDLFESGAILIRQEKGRKKHEKRNRKRKVGKIKKRIKNRKRDYIRLTRKLRSFANQLKFQGRINQEQYKEIRKQIKSKIFRSKSHFKEIIKPGNKITEKKEKVQKEKIKKRIKKEGDKNENN